MSCYEQQDDLYRVERDLSYSRRNAFTNIQQVQDFVDGLRETWWWERWISGVLRVEVGHARRNASFAGVGWFDKEAKAGRLEFRPDVPLTRRLVVHELSHVIAAWRVGKPAHHSPWFARVYYELTYLILGASYAAELAQSFKTHGVDYDAMGITEWTR